MIKLKIKKNSKIDPPNGYPEKGNVKKELMKFMKYMAINDIKPWQNYEQVVNEYLSTKNNKK